MAKPTTAAPASPIPAPGKFAFVLSKPAYRDGVYYDVGETMTFDNPDHAPEGAVSVREGADAGVARVASGDAPRVERAADSSPV